MAIFQAVRQSLSPTTQAVMPWYKERERERERLAEL